MNKPGLYLLLLALVFGVFQACGPSEEEKRAAEQARLDSLRQAEQTRLAQIQKAREDSLARVEQAAQMLEEERNAFNFSEDGNYVVQVGAWRSQEKAESYKQKWADRDYANLYVVKFGDDNSGDVWYRVRVGFFDTKEDAEKLGVQLSQEINSGYWVSKVQRSN